MATKKAVVKATVVKPHILESAALVPATPAAVAVADPMTVLQRAVKDGASVDVLERLLGLQERWEANQARKAFDRAMADLRGDLPTIVKSSVVDFTTAKGRTNYKHEDLAAITEAISPAMARHGLAFRWQTDSTQAKSISVTCIVSHADGHSERTTLSAAPDDSGNKNDIQAIGSAVTYLQRYTLKAAIGIAAAKDDDALARSRPEPVAKPSRPAGQKARPPAQAVAPIVQNPKAGEAITTEQLKRLWTIARSSGRSDEAVKQWLMACYGLNSSKEIRRKDYETITTALEHPGPLPLDMRDVEWRPGSGDTPREPGEEG